MRMFFFFKTKATCEVDLTLHKPLSMPQQQGNMEVSDNTDDSVRTELQFVAT